MCMKRVRTIFLTGMVCIFSLFGIQHVFASTTNGSISANSYAWGENLGWINFGCAQCTLHVTDTALTGDVWSAQYGWINLSPTNGGVTNDGNGNLGGTAWSSGLGWISFIGVVINSSGVFSGITGGQGSTAGRINFSCTHCSVVTDWRPASVRTVQNSSGGSSGGSSSSGSLVGGNSLVNSNVSTTTTSPLVAAVVSSEPPRSEHVTVVPSGLSQDVLEGTKGWVYTTSNTPHIAKKGIVTFANTGSSSLASKIGLNQLSSTAVYIISTTILGVVLLALFILRFL